MKLNFSRFVICLLSFSACTFSIAGPFEIAASPSRFELASKSGVRVGQSLDIYNVGKSASEVSLRTLDWSYSEAGVVSYFDELQPNSCRSWVTLERKTVVVTAGSKRTFRFQIDIPADAPRGECRFMLAVEGVEPAHKALLDSGGGLNLSLPVTGRIAIAVYVAINGAAPKLSLTQLRVQDVKGSPTAAAIVTNQGDAHGRLDGSLDATDAKGQIYELNVEGTPIMPGQSRVLPFTAKSMGNKSAEKSAEVLTFPLKAKGILDWDNGSFKVDAEFK
jgi:fimbrial chaperone protein